VSNMDKIEFWLDEKDPAKTGWYINTYDKLGHDPIDTVGPYETKTAALRVWRSTTPDKREPSDAGHEHET
jgi:hypothetical protein